MFFNGPSREVDLGLPQDTKLRRLWDVRWGRPQDDQIGSLGHFLGGDQYLLGWRVVIRSMFVYHLVDREFRVETFF